MGVPVMRARADRSLRLRGGASEVVLRVEREGEMARGVAVLRMRWRGPASATARRGRNRRRRRSPAPSGCMRRRGGSRRERRGDCGRATTGRGRSTRPGPRRRPTPKGRPPRTRRTIARSTAERRVRSMAASDHRRPAIGVGRNGKAVAMPFGVRLLPARAAVEVHAVAEPVVGTPPQHAFPLMTPATARMAMSVTSSFGRRPLGQPAGSGVGLPAASWASTVSRRWLAGGVGGTVRSRRSRSASAPPRRVLEQHAHQVGARRRRDRDPEGEVQERGEPRVLIEAQELRPRPSDPGCSRSPSVRCR